MMAKTEEKLAFKFIGEKIESIQNEYENLIKDTSYLYLKYELHLTNIQNKYLAPKVRSQNLDTFQFDDIRELQIGLKDFKN